MGAEIEQTKLGLFPGMAIIDIMDSNISLAANMVVLNYQTMLPTRITSVLGSR